MQAKLDEKIKIIADYDCWYDEEYADIAEEDEKGEEEPPEQRTGYESRRPSNREQYPRKRSPTPASNYNRSTVGDTILSMHEEIYKKRAGQGRD